MSHRLARAIAFASCAHVQQLDKAGEAYILHPMRVMHQVRMMGLDVDAQIAAVLHDVVEDTDATLDQVRGEFGNTVAEIVDAVTRRDKEVYRDFVARAAKHPIGRIVKIADITDNLLRLNKLPDKERLGLSERYARALQIIRATEIEG